MSTHEGENFSQKCLQIDLQQKLNQLQSESKSNEVCNML